MVGGGGVGGGGAKKRILCKITADKDDKDKTLADRLFSSHLDSTIHDHVC